MGFTRAQLESFRDAEVPDLIGPGLRLLFVGINPGLWTAAAAAHFARPGNRFYPALHRGGILPHRIDASAGMRAEDSSMLTARGIGITNLAPRATARADQLTAEELREAPNRLQRIVAEHQPRVVAIAGITAYRVAFCRRQARAGIQDESIGDAGVWVVPNPSGLNAHASLEVLAAAYREVAMVAGVLPRPD